MAGRPARDIREQGQLEGEGETERWKLGGLELARDLRNRLWD